MPIMYSRVGIPYKEIEEMKARSPYYKKLKEARNINPGSNLVNIGLGILLVIVVILFVFN